MDQTTDITGNPLDPAGEPAPAVDLDKAAPHAPGPAPLPGGGRSYPASLRPAFRLRRSRTDRMLGGVCGGLAKSLGVDVTLLRIGLVALTVLGAGTGAVLYVAAWILAPEENAA